MDPLQDERVGAWSAADPVIDAIAAGGVVVAGAAVLGRHVVLREIGSGGSARVVLVRDRTGAELAVKVLRSERISETGLARFRLEYRALARIRHPNVVRVHGFGRAGVVPYLVLEYVEGPSLREHARRIRLLPPDERYRRIEEIVADLCHGLAVTHRAGLVHRDVKASNVLVAGDGVCKLADFGVVRDIAEQLDREDLVGTWAYAAPEQFREGAVDHRADLYALGVVLFELLVGRRPFKADTVRDFAAHHTLRPAPDPRDLVPEVPLRLAHLCLSLLRKNPRRRIQSAEAVLARLGEPDATRSQGVAAGLWRPPFVGREALRTALAELLDSTAGGHGGATTLLGGPGSGRSRVLEEVASSARKRGLLVMRLEFREGVPAFTAIYQFAGALRSELGAECPPRLAAALSADQRPTGGAYGARYALFEGVREGMLRIARDTPVAVLIDDLYRASTTERQLIAGLVGSLLGTDPVPVAFVTATDAPPRGAIATTAIGDVARHHLLPPLDVEQVIELVVELVGESLVARLLARRLFQETGGRPKAVVATLRALVRAGYVTGPRGHATIHLTAHEVSEIRLVRSAAAKALGYLEGLGPEAKSVLGLLALARRELDTELVTEVLGGDSARVGGGVDDLLATGLVCERLVPEGALIGLDLDVVGESLGTELPAREQQALHLALAEALERRPRRDPPTLEWIASHYLAGGALAPAHAALVQAAGTCRDTSLVREARRLCRQAAAIEPRLTPEDAASIRDRANLDAELLVSRGAWVGAVAALEPLLADAEARGDAVAAADQRARLAVATRHVGRRAQSQRHAELALRDARAVGHTRAEAEASRELSTLARQLGDLDAATAHAVAGIAAARSGRHAYERAGLQRALAAIRIDQGRFDDARESLVDADRVLRALEHRAGRSALLTDMARLERIRGDLSDAHDHAELALFLSTELGYRVGRARAGAEVARVAHCMGRLSRAHSIGREALRLATNLRMVELARETALVMQEICLDQGDFAESLWHADHAGAMSRVADARGWHALERGLRARALAATDPARARSLLTHFDPASLPVPLSAEAALHMAWACKALGQLDLARRYARASLDEATWRGLPVHQIRAHALLGHLPATYDARVHLGRAKVISERAGAHFTPSRVDGWNRMVDWWLDGSQPPGPG